MEKNIGKSENAALAQNHESARLTMSIHELELSLEKTLREAHALRRALLARIAEGEEDLKVLRRRAADVEVIIEHTQAALGQSGVSGLVSPTTESDSPSIDVPRRTARGAPRYGKPPLRPDLEPISHRFRGLTATQAAVIALREAGGPLHVNAIFNTLCENGFEFRGDHPTISLAVALARSKRFRKVAPATFDLVIRDVPVQRAVESS